MFKYSIIFLLIILSGNVIAQNSAGAVWELTDPDQGGTGLTASIEGNLIAEQESLINTEINHYSGPDNSQRVRILGNAWPANQTSQIDSVYIQFTLSPKTGFNFNVNSISLGIAAASINTMKANIYYSTDPDFNSATMIEYSTGDLNGNNYLSRDELTQVNSSPDLSVNNGEKLYVRIYPWVDNDPSERTGKYVCIKNVVISGEIESLPTAASAIWTFETDDNPTTSGSVIAKQQSYSSGMKFYTDQFPVLPATDNSGDVTCGAIQTVSKTWNAEPEISDSLFFQYAVSPKYGGTFFIDSVSMYIGGWFTDKLKAAVYYSQDSTFTERKLLFADMSLPGNSVMPISSALSDTVETGATFYLRVYPHNTEAQGWAKLVAVHNVVISGTTIGVTADPPKVTTSFVSDISTTFASSGGNISTDGGAAVTSRGLVWATHSSPTIGDSKSDEGGGSGSFTSVATGLMPGTVYYLRAYATNDAGTSYGSERSFTTLDSITVPTVYTSSISNILVNSAEGGGSVSSWGGDTVVVKGVCWNTTGSPTTENSKTENGSGTGSFNSSIFPISQSTTYYVRAYATNSKGTGYGSEVSFTTKAPEPDVYKVVAKDGSGDYTTVQGAFNDVPDLYTGVYEIFVKNGIYYEKLYLDRNKVNVVLRGESADSTILSYDDYAGKAGGTSMSYSVAIDADDFKAFNITFQNTVVNDGSFNDQQGVALRVNGDRQAYYNCKLLGYQDTYYTWGGRATGRTYMKNCYIEGSVDFIFGRNVVLFDSCEIHINRNGGTLTAASTEAVSKFGYVFKDCIISADSIGFNGQPITSFVLGRPWQEAPRTVYINCYEPASVSSSGWSTWNVTPGLYAEYKCYGPGSDHSNRISIGKQLSDEEALDYTIENIFSKNSHPDFGYDWLPTGSGITGTDLGFNSELVPTAFSLSQNYPNPFNPATVIEYMLPKTSLVELNVYNILGQKVRTLINSLQSPGSYKVNFNSRDLASGIYIYRIKAGEFTQTRKMLLIK